MEKSEETVAKIWPYDGYQGRPLFEEDDRSTYYNYKIDSQCRVPLPNMHDLLLEIEEKEISKDDYSE